MKERYAAISPSFTLTYTDTSGRRPDETNNTSSINASRSSSLPSRPAARMFQQKVPRPLLILHPRLAANLSLPGAHPPSYLHLYIPPTAMRLRQAKYRRAIPRYQLQDTRLPGRRRWLRGPQMQVDLCLVQCHHLRRLSTAGERGGKARFPTR